MKQDLFETWGILRWHESVTRDCVKGQARFAGIMKMRERKIAYVFYKEMSSKIEEGWGQALHSFGKSKA
jgi:hypothetical protein